MTRSAPVGSQRPRMYGLPKIHKEGVPLRPILSMIGSPQHELAKWLADILDPVLQKFSVNCIADSLRFASFIRDLECESHTNFLCSFDVTSLFTNVPLNETIEICADMLYRSTLTPPAFPESIFLELMGLATKSVSFSF